MISRWLPDIGLAALVLSAFAPEVGWTCLPLVALGLVIGMDLEREERRR